MRKRFLAMVMGLVLTASMITGCTGNSSSDSSSNTASSSGVSASEETSSSNSDTASDSSRDSANDTETDEYTVYGKVTSVSDDGKVTYEVLSKDENRPQIPQGNGTTDGKNGEKPQMPQGSMTPDGKNGEKPQMPQGSMTPDDKNGGIPGFKSTGEKATVTLSDDVTVQKSGMDQTKTDATVSDIKKGSIIGLAFDGDNVTKVLIREVSQKGEKGKKSETSDNTNSTE